MKYKEKLLNSLKALETVYNINTWHDGKILAGSDIDKRVLAQLSKSQVVILLLTQNFLSSHYCINIELTNAIEKMKNGKCVVVPVLYQECTIMKEHLFYRLNRVPADGKPISGKSFKNQTVGCAAATDMIKDMIDKTFPKCKKEIAPTEESKTNAKITKVKTTQPTSVKNPEGQATIELIKNGTPQPIPISQAFINGLPKYVDSLMNFNTMMEQALANAVKRYKKEYKKYTPDKLEEFRLTQFKLFLMDICSYIKKHVTGSLGIRVHFRGNVHDEYVGIIASTDNQDSDDLETNWTTDLTPIPIYKGLIHYSFSLKLPLLKSLNPRLNYKATNNDVWKEYLTHAFVDLSKGTNAIMSMGISVHKNFFTLKKDLLQFLAYINFGKYIEDYILRYFSQCKATDKSINIESVISSLN